MFVINATDYAPVTPVTPPCDIIPIFIGYKGENHARCLTFDLTECIEEFGEGGFAISFIRHGDAQPYLVTDTDQLDYTAIWEINSTDTAVEGYGMVQLQYIVGETVCKTAMYRTVTFDSNESAGDVPDPYTNLLDQIAAYAAQAQAGAVSAASSAASAKDYADHIADPVGGLVTDWLDEHVDPETGYVLDDSLTVEGAAADAKAVGDALKTEQENLTAGNALQLASNNYAEDSVPYVYRVTGGGVDVGDREFEQLVGGTVAWNQLAPKPPNSSFNGISMTVSDSGLCTFTGTASAQWNYNLNYASGTERFISGHVYYMGKATGVCKLQLLNSSSAFFTVDGDVEAVKKVSFTPNGTSWARIRFESGAVSNDSTCYPMVADLTQMFGSTVADYLATLESGSAGAGVAKLHEWGYFTENYYAYDTGSLQSVNTSRHDTVGFNQWDEVWEVGGYDATTGALVPSSSTIRSKNYIEIIPTQTYYFKNPINTRFFQYDANHAYLGTFLARNTTLTLNVQTRYLTFHYTATNYQNDVCLNVSDPVKNGTYEPYEKHTYALDASLTLRGVPKLVDNKLTYDGDTYESDGTVTRKYCEPYNLGTFSYTYVENGGYFYTSFGTKKNGEYNLITSCYTTSASTTGVSGMNDKEIKGAASSYTIYIKDSGYTDGTALKNALNGQYVVFELATPTTETADPYQSPQICANGGTEQYVVTEQNGVGVPVGHVTKYPTDQVAKLDGLPSNFSTLIAPVEQAFKATRNYTVGTYLIVNNQLYRVTSAIANGGTITLNTNVTATTIMAEILSL